MSVKARGMDISRGFGMPGVSARVCDAWLSYWILTVGALLCPDDMVFNTSSYSQET